MSKVRILAQSPGWLAIHKPAGVSFHSEDGTPGIVAQCEAELGQSLWPVHRLDKVTSGVLLFATDATMAAYLSQQFAEQNTRKLYLALSDKKPSKKQGWIKGDMEKARNGSYKLLRSQNNPAVTRFATHFDDVHATRWFLLRPYSGKTHQLRVAMKSLGAPILGDARYSGSPSTRTCLHAWQLRFHDGTGEQHVTCLPDCPDWPVAPTESVMEWLQATSSLLLK